LTGTPSKVRIGHAATLLPSGRVLISGGYEPFQPGVSGGDLASAELYDPATGLWQETASMTGPRTNHAAILLRTGEVLVAGGYSGLLPEGLIGPTELYSEEPAACGQDISGRVDVVAYPPWTVSLFLRFQYVLIHNKTTLPIAGPIALVMHDLQRAAFIGTNFRTGCFGGDDPFTLVPIGSDNVLSPNESALQGLWFFKTAIGPLSYSPIVWSAISPE